MTELGKRLKEAREAKRISLDELQEMTKIQKRYLIGIEEGNYAIMPGNFYVRAFIKQYAEAVGLDSEELFEEYKHEIPNTQPEELPQQLSRVKSRQQLSAQSSKIIDMLPKVLVAAFIIGAGVVIWLFLQNRDVNETPKENIVSNATEVEQSKNSPLEKAAKQQKEKMNKKEKENSGDSNVQSKETAQKLTVLEKNGNESAVELANSKQFVLEVTSKGTSWVEVRNGKGHSFFASNLQSNQTQQFDLTNESEVLVKIGRATDVEMKINGQPFAYPIDPQEEVYQKIKILFKKS